MSYTGVPVI
jgi:hypothetical protein